MQPLQDPEQPTGQRGHRRKAAEVDRAVQAGHLLGLDLVDQLRPHPQAGLTDCRTARGNAHARAHVAHHVAGRTGFGTGGHREGSLLAGSGNPRAEEVVLQERDPAAGGLLVERAVVNEVLVFALLVLVGGGEPRRALEAVLLRAHRCAAFQRPRHPCQLAVGEPLPRRRPAIDHLIAHVHHIDAAAEGVGAMDAHPVGAVPDERHHHLVGAAGKSEGVPGRHCRTIKLEPRQMGRGRTAAADPTALGDEEIRRVLAEQTHRRAVIVRRAGIGQQVGLQDRAAVECHGQHVGADGDRIGGRGERCGLRQGGRSGAHRRYPGHPLGASRSGRHGHTRYASAGNRLGNGMGRRERRRCCLLLVPLHPQQCRHHQPGEDQE